MRLKVVKMKIVEVDDELYQIIQAMKRDPLANKAIRRYAKAFLYP